MFETTPTLGWCICSSGCMMLVIVAGYSSRRLIDPSTICRITEPIIGLNGGRIHRSIDPWAIFPILIALPPARGAAAMPHEIQVIAVRLLYEIFTDQSWGAAQGVLFRKRGRARTGGSVRRCGAVLCIHQAGPFAIFTRAPIEEVHRAMICLPYEVAAAFVVDQHT
jgi:hypothetical protein